MRRQDEPVSDAIGDRSTIQLAAARTVPPTVALSLSSRIRRSPRWSHPTPRSFTQPYYRRTRRSGDSRWSSGLTQSLSQRPHDAYQLPHPPPGGEGLSGVPAMPIVAVARLLGSTVG